MAALEAMAAGKPLIMTDVGGAAEMLENGFNGFLYPPGDVDALVARVKTLIDQNAFNEMGRNSREIVTDRFTLKKMVNDYENILSEL